jgi:tRNA threonylcarbamoyladenosine biosynthesis protein TsaB
MLFAPIITLRIALALHTTTENLEIAIALLDRETLTYTKSKSWHLGRELATQIHTCLLDCFDGYEWSDLAFMAIAKGVGGFTSTRIGIVLARTLGEQLNIPVYAVDCRTIQEHAEIDSPAKSLGVSLLAIAHDQWQQNIYPNWYEALPVYDSE